MGLQLRLHEVFAKDETNTLGTEFGSDDIHFGGVSLELRGPEAKPTVHRLPLFRVGTFDDGDRVTFDKPKVIDNYGFGPNVFPKKIAVMLMLAETDKSNDFEKAIDKVHQETEARAEQILKADNTVLDPEGEFQGDGIDWEKWVKHLWEFSKFVFDNWKGDEIFDPHSFEFTVLNEQHRWNGSETSPVQEAHFKGHGGHYILKYDLNMNFLPSGT